MHGIEKANHASRDWRFRGFRAGLPFQRWFWWFAADERSAHLARKTGISSAKCVRD